MTENESSDLQAEVVVNPQGRVTIPSQLRRDAGIEVGSSLVMYVEDGRVVLESREQLAERLRRDVAESWRGDRNRSVVDELIADRRAEVAAENPQR